MLKVNFKDVLIIIFISIFSSLVISIFYNIFPPRNLETHVPHGSDEVIERNYDGPIYVVLAITLYNQNKLRFLNFNKLPTIYFANHFPLLPVLIKLSTFLTHNYFRSIILITWLTTVFFTLFFYFFLIKFKFSQHPLLLSVVSLFMPPRWLAVRTVGGTEPLFMLILIISLYFWIKKKYLFAYILAAFMVLTRPPGIYLFFCFLAIIFYQSLEIKTGFKKILIMFQRHWSIVVMPLTLILLFSFYEYVFGDFWAYFKTGTGTNIHFRLIPFAGVLDNNSPIVETILYLYIIYLAGIYFLWKQKFTLLALFSLVYLIPNFFMTVDDISRYLLPISPFCIVIGYQKIWQHKAFKYFFMFFLIGIYIYTLSLLPQRMFNYNDYAFLRLNSYIK